MPTVKEISEEAVLYRACIERAKNSLRTPNPIKFTVRHDVTVAGDTYETLYNRAVTQLARAYLDLETLERRQSE